MKRLLMLMITTIFHITTANAGAYYTGNFLLRMLNAETVADSQVTYSQGLGYIAGISDSFDEWLICTPQNATLGQLAKVVKKYLDANPEKLNQPASSLAFTALRSVWPCAQKESASPAESAPKPAKLQKPTPKPKEEESPF